MEEMTALRKLQLAELEIYKQVADICDRHHITYYMSAGTFLGAVRHKGFIPWDDDMDMRVPRPDYERLLEALREELPEPYALRHYTWDKSYHRYFAKVENRNVRFRRTHTVKTQETNAWIDIFPLDGMPKNSLRARLRKIRLMTVKLWMQLSVFDEIIDIKKKRSAYEKLLIFIAMHTPLQKHISWDRMWKRMDRALKAYPPEKSDVWMNFFSSYKFRDIMPKTVYGSGRKYPFEDTELNGPEDYDAFLKQLYGDYMQLPPEDAQNKHFIDSNTLEFLN